MHTLTHSNTQISKPTRIVTRSKLYTNTNKILQNIKHRKQYSWDLKWKKEWERFLWMCKGYKIYKLEWEMKNKEGNTKIFQSFCFCQLLLLPLGFERKAQPRWRTKRKDENEMQWKSIKSLRKTKKTKIKQNKIIKELFGLSFFYLRFVSRSDSMYGYM